MSDGSNASGKACSGISIGLGFTGKKIKDPTKVASSDASAPPDPCTATPDAGGGDTGTTTDAGGGG
jgi:hypothetical protein